MMTQSLRMTFLLLSLTCIIPPSYGAIEFYRFQGSIAADADVAGLGLGLETGQSVYFDFAIETTPFSTSWLSDIYPAVFLRGSTTGYRGTTLGFDITTPEATVGNLFTQIPDANALRDGELVQGLLIDHAHPIAFDFALPDLGVGAWTLGQNLRLRIGSAYQFTNAQQIGELSLTYRATEAPPPIPLPASVWLLAGAFAVMLCYRLRTLVK